MHPVIEHLNSRRGKTVPANDGRKIALVHLGGAMSGVRGAGAMIAFEELELSDAFDTIYAVSCGLANTSYLLTHNTRLGTSIYYDDLCEGHFISLKRFWNIADVDLAVKAISDLKPLDFGRLSSSPTCIFAKLLNTRSHLSEWKNLNGLSATDIQTIMRAAMSIPYFNPGSIEIGGIPYKDAGRERDKWSSDITHALESDATDIIVIHNLFESYQKIRTEEKFHSDRIFHIVPPEGKELLLPICMDPKILKEKAIEMGTLVKCLFGSEQPISLS